MDAMNAAQAAAHVQKTRRTHTKSRGGCQECKRRKLKCDEDKPICHGCRKREIPCDYTPVVRSRPPSLDDRNHTHDPSRHPAIPNLMTTPEAAHSQMHTPHSIAISEPMSVSAQKRASAIFDMEDMALWHHFIKSTAATLLNPWGEELPQHALTCDYLLHGILAVSALHLAYLNPGRREKFTHLASYHQDLVYPALNRGMEHVTSKNGSHLFAASTLVIIFNYASFNTTEHMFPFAQTSNEGASNWMICLRGCSTIARTTQAHVEAGPLGFLLTQGRNLQAALATGARPKPEDDESLKQISDMVLNLPSIKSSTTVEEMDAYNDAIEKLRNMLAACSQDLDSFMKRAICGIWPATVHETFIRLLSERRPPALMIMAHYCLLLADVRDCWYFENRGLHLFKGVEKELGEEWSPYIAHPRQIITEKS